MFHEKRSENESIQRFCVRLMQKHDQLATTAFICILMGPPRANPATLFQLEERSKQALWWWCSGFEGRFEVYTRAVEVRGMHRRIILVVCKTFSLSQEDNTESIGTNIS